MWLAIGIGAGVYAVVCTFAYALCKSSAHADRLAAAAYSEETHND